MIENRNSIFICQLSERELRDQNLYAIAVKKKPGLSWIKNMLSGALMVAVRTTRETIEYDAGVAFRVEPGSYIVTRDVIADILYDKGHVDEAAWINETYDGKLDSLAFTENEVQVLQKISPIPYSNQINKNFLLNNS